MAVQYKFHYPATPGPVDMDGSTNGMMDWIAPDTRSVEPNILGDIPFLGIPVELRILCYRYLVPNIDFVFNRSSPFDNTTSDLRSDGDSCTPAILRVSKQVYREAIKEFYGYRTFTLEILNLGGPMGFNFLSQECLWDKDLPSIFFSVKKLCLSLEFSSSPDLERSRQLARIVRHCFLERASCLESLHIQIEPGARFWLQHMRYLDKLPITIDCYLGPLMEVRGLSTVTVGKVEYKFMTERSLAIIETKDRMLRDLDAALDELKNLMVLPWPETALGPSLLQNARGEIFAIPTT